MLCPMDRFWYLLLAMEYLLQNLLKLAKELKVNYKTARLLQSKYRILMRDSNVAMILDLQFYESDVANTGTHRRMVNAD